MADDLQWLDATATAEAVRAGALSPLEVLDAAIARIERLDPALNAVVHPRLERARDEARGAAGLAVATAGPLWGVPFLLKDAVCRSGGDPYHAGSRVLRDAGFVAPHDSWLATRFAAAGLVRLGRTNTPELAASATTEPLAFGPTRNPWDAERSPGGSSGGSAAAVASGMVPVAHGNDMGGSIRIPAGWCGLVGLKPTRGRTTLGPDHGEYWSTLTHEHVLARSVRDTAAVLDAVAGPAPGDPWTAPPPARPFVEEVGAPVGRLRLALRTDRLDGAGPAHPEVRTAVERTGALLEELGHEVEPDALACLDSDGPFAAMGTVVSAWLAHEVAGWSALLGRVVDPDELEPLNAASVRRGRSLTAGDYLAAIDDLNRYARRATRWNERADVLVLPTSPTPPPPLGVMGPMELEDHPDYDRRGPAVFTLPFDITGEPAVSLPLHWTADGLPVGVQLVAPFGREDLLLRVAAQLERARPWADRHPAVS